MSSVAKLWMCCRSRTLIRRGRRVGVLVAALSIALLRSVCGVTGVFVDWREGSLGVIDGLWLFGGELAVAEVELLPPLGALCDMKGSVVRRGDAVRLWYADGVVLLWGGREGDDVS